MPQFEKLYFLSQISWTFILFFVYYFCMKSIFLPIIIEKLFLKSSLLKLKTSVDVVPIVSNSQYPEFK